ncbi:MAG TPA: squalene synthase HpnC [bacterium]|nr:squalene synthase HpnC [bacterium]
MTPSLQEAFAHCERLAKSHYENFPIGWFIPKASRKYVYAIYAFARTADDFSDEKSFDGQRVEKLNDYERRLNRALEGQADDPVFVAVAETIRKTGIPAQLLRDLLTAFRMDVTKKRYKDYKELETYCVYSANPVGRIVLLLFGIDDPKLLELSDRICTGIQLVNHWQDVGVDLDKDRVYLPEEDIVRFGYSYASLTDRKVDDAFRSLMQFQVSRARSLFQEGKPLLNAIGKKTRRLKWQVSLMWSGPMRILDKIEAVDYDVFRKRPTLTKAELMKLFLFS